MEKEKIIKTFLEKGYQLDSNSLEFFFENPEKQEIFISKIKNIRIPPTISLEFARSLIEQDVEVLKIINPFKDEKPFTIESMTKHFTSRYESIKKYFIGRFELVNLISINKITPNTRKFSLIVMVKEKNGNSLLVEDFTGDTSVEVLDKTLDQIVLDEVIGIVCEQDDETITVNKIIFPDIPLKRDIPKTEKDICALFLSDIFLDRSVNSEKILERINEIKCEKIYVFVLGNISSNLEEIKNFFNQLPLNSYKIFLKGEIDPDAEVGDINFSSSAALIKIENKITILLCNGKIFSEYKKIWAGQTSENIMLNLLKKRHLNPVFELNKRISEEDSYTIDQVPDIFISSNFGNPGITNYKGTTIISNGSFLSEPIYWLINLRTRENIKMTLAKEI
jgi:DNA polymerase II small subunit/DNA polymerase delta subunit B